MTLLHDVRAITIADGSVGSFAAGSMTIANARMPVIAPSFNWISEKTARARVRATIGSVEAVAGKNMMEMNFGVELKGSGVAGTAPSIGQALIGCGFAETVNSGTAVTGPSIANPANKGFLIDGTTKGPVLTSAGTFVGTKNGRYHIVLDSFILSTSVTFRWYFQPDDGTAGSTGTFTCVLATAVAMDDGVTIAIADPTATEIGTNYVVGDRWILNMTSSSTSEVLYRPIKEASVQDIAFMHDGRVFKMHSARGTCRATHTNGEWTRVDFTFRGICDDPNGSNGYADLAILTGIDWEDTSPPAAMGVTYLFDGVTKCFSDFSWDIGNDIAMRECMTEPTGYKEARIVRRNATGSVSHEAELKATANPYDKFINGGTDAVSFVQGDESGNIITFTFPNAVTMAVNDQDRDGVSVDQLDLAFVEPEDDAGGDFDEIKIKFT